MTGGGRGGPRRGSGTRWGSVRWDDTPSPPRLSCSVNTRRSQAFHTSLAATLKKKKMGVVGVGWGSAGRGGEGRAQGERERERDMSNTSTLIMLMSPAPGPPEPVPRSPPLIVALRCCPLPCQMGLVLRGGRPGSFGRGLVSSWRSAAGRWPLLSKEGECKNLSTLTYSQEYTKKNT